MLKRGMLRAQIVDIEKREKRLKEVFNAQIVSFREAVFFLFGYRVDMASKAISTTKAGSAPTTFVLTPPVGAPADRLLHVLSENPRYTTTLHGTNCALHGKLQRTLQSLVRGQWVELLQLPDAERAADCAQGGDEKMQLMFALKPKSGGMQLLPTPYTERLKQEVETYIGRFRSIPAFLANLTMENFQKSSQI